MIIRLPAHNIKNCGKEHCPADIWRHVTLLNGVSTLVMATNILLWITLNVIVRNKVRWSAMMFKCTADYYCWDGNRKCKCECDGFKDMRWSPHLLLCCVLFFIFCVAINIVWRCNIMYTYASALSYPSTTTPKKHTNTSVFQIHPLYVQEQGYYTKRVCE